MTGEAVLHRRTTGLCDACLREVPARVVLQDGRAVLARDCPDHGERRAVLSDRGPDYLRLDRAYHATFRPDQPVADREDTYFFVTNRCNQSCAYCLTEANRHPYFDAYGPEAFLQGLRAHRGSKVSLIGGEPTVHPDFLWFAAQVAAAGRTLVVYTNGLALADPAFADRLVATAPRLEVRMTVEGFEPSDYEGVGGAALHRAKMAALANLERHAVPVTLGHTIDRSEDAADSRRRLGALVGYAASHRFVRGLTFQGTMALGASRDADVREALSVDQVMDRVAAALPSPLPREEAYLAQKMVYVLARVLGLPICAYVQTLVLVRGRDGWVGLGHFLHAGRLDRLLDRRLSVPRSRAALLAGFLGDVARSLRWARLPLLLRRAMEVLPVFARRYDFASIPRTVLPLLSITVCDRHFLDTAVARRCEKDVRSVVRGQVVQELCSAMMIRQLRERVGGPPGDAAAGPVPPAEPPPG